MYNMFSCNLKLLFLCRIDTHPTMASPPRQAPVVPLDLLLGEGADNLSDQPVNANSNASSSPQSPASLSLALESPEGIDCHGNERQALLEQAKFYNNPLLSDVTLVVGNEQYFAHKLVLVRASDVFERMFSSEWDTADDKSKVSKVFRLLVKHSMPQRQNIYMYLYSSFNIH